MEKKRMCTLEKHKAEELKVICFNQACPGPTRICCIKCILQYHKSCIDHMAEIEAIKNNDIAEFQAIIPQSQIVELVALKSKLAKSQTPFDCISFLKSVNIYKLEEFLSSLGTEFKGCSTGIAETMKSFIDESFTKDSIRTQAKQIGEILEQFAATCDFKEVWKSIDSIDKGEITMEAFNKAVGGFSKRIALEERALQAKSSLVFSIVKDYSKHKARFHDMLFKFQQSIIPSFLRWGFTETNKDPNILIDQGDAHARKVLGEGSHSAFYGDIEMSKKLAEKHFWKLLPKANNSAISGQWILFGIVKKESLSGFANVWPKCALCMCSRGSIIRDGISKIIVSTFKGDGNGGDQDGRVHLMTLDFIERRFTIQVENTDLKIIWEIDSEATYIPCFQLHTPGNEITILEAN